MSAGGFSTSPNSLVGGAYSLNDQQALRVSDAGTVALAYSGRYALEQTHRPYRYGQSDPRLRPAV